MTAGNNTIAGTHTTTKAINIPPTGLNSAVVSYFQPIISMDATSRSTVVADAVTSAFTFGMVVPSAFYALLFMQHQHNTSSFLPVAMLFGFYAFLGKFRVFYRILNEFFRHPGTVLMMFKCNDYKQLMLNTVNTLATSVSVVAWVYWAINAMTESSNMAKGLNNPDAAFLANVLNSTETKAIVGFMSSVMNLILFFRLNALFMPICLEFMEIWCLLPRLLVKSGTYLINTQKQYAYKANMVNKYGEIFAKYSEIEAKIWSDSLGSDVLFSMRSFLTQSVLKLFSSGNYEISWDESKLQQFITETIVPIFGSDWRNLETNEAIAKLSAYVTRNTLSNQVQHGDYLGRFIGFAAVLVAAFGYNSSSLLARDGILALLNCVIKVDQSTWQYIMPFISAIIIAGNVSLMYSTVYNRWYKNGRSILDKNTNTINHMFARKTVNLINVELTLGCVIGVLPMLFQAYYMFNQSLPLVVFAGLSSFLLEIEGAKQVSYINRLETTINALANNDHYATGDILDVLNFMYLLYNAEFLVNTSRCPSPTNHSNISLLSEV